ncbi:hypothetical protein MJ581_07895 [Escherichia coli]|nr:hypothetical protein MJ581_07895 [Escherichia coli]
MPQIPRAPSCRRRTTSCSVAFVDAVVALPFAADACLVASSLKQTQMMPMTPPDLADDAAAVFGACAGFRRFARSVSDVFAQAFSLLRWPVRWLPSLWLCGGRCGALPFSGSGGTWLRPARHLLTRHWRATHAVLSLPQLRALCPLPSQDTAFVSVLPPSQNLLPPLPRAALLALEMHSFLVICRLF